MRSLKRKPDERVTAMKRATLCFLLRRTTTAEVLLGWKKTGFGRGKYNGFGGKLLPGESFVEGAVREVWEEAGVQVDPDDLVHGGELWFIYPGDPQNNHHARVYTTEVWLGEPRETPEMRARWFTFANVPYEQMWQDDIYWLPTVLSGGTIHAEVLFALDGESIAEFRILPTAGDRS